MVTEVRPLQSSKAAYPMLVTELGMTVFGHPAISVLVFVSMMALLLPRESYTVFPLSTTELNKIKAAKYLIEASKDIDKGHFPQYHDAVKDVESININKILESRDLKLSEAIADIIDNRFEAVEFSDKLEAKDILFIELPNYKTFVKEEKVVKKEEYPKEEKKDIGNYNNDFGKASILILVGAILITLGVIITIIMTMVGG